MTYEPLTFNANNAILALAVVGGNIEVVKDATVVIPVKYVMADGKLVQPKFSDLTITSAATSTASVSNGVLTGVAVGTTTLSISVTDSSAGVDAITVGVSVVAS